MINKIILSIWLFPFAVWTAYREWATKDVDRVFKGAKTLPVPGGKWKVAPPLPSYRYEVGCALAGNKVYIIGGINAPTLYTVSRLNEAYDIRTKKWGRRADYPVIIHHPGTTSDGENVYVTGGNGLRIFSYRLTHVYKPKLDQWLRLADMPTKRCALGLSYWRGKIYAIGGADNKRPLTTLEEYDIKTDSWKQLPNMPTAREHLFSVAAKGKIFALGGYHNDRFHCVNSLEAYDVRTKKWHRLAPMPAKVCGFGACVWKNSIFVFGGEQGWSISREVYEYLINKNTWRRRLDMPVPRYSGAVAAAGDGFHVIGGNTRMFTHHFSFDHDIFLPK